MTDLKIGESSFFEAPQRLNTAKVENDTLTESQFLELFISPVNIVALWSYAPSMLSQFDQKTRGVYNKRICSTALAWKQTKTEEYLQDRKNFDF